MKIDLKIKKLHDEMIKYHDKCLKEGCEIGTFDNEVIPKFAASMWQAIKNHVKVKCKICNTREAINIYEEYDWYYCKKCWDHFMLPTLKKIHKNNKKKKEK